MATEKNTTPFECGLCHKPLTGYNEIKALFVGKICLKCEKAFKRTTVPSQGQYHAQQASLRKYVRDFESGKSNPDQIKVRHLHRRTPSDINTIRAASNRETRRKRIEGSQPIKPLANLFPLPLTSAGNLKP